GRARHGEGPADIAENRRQGAEAKAHGGFVATIRGDETVIPSRFITPALDSLVKGRGGTGPATAADSAPLRAGLQALIDLIIPPAPAGPNRPGPTQCHDT